MKGKSVKGEEGRLQLSLFEGSSLWTPKFWPYWQHRLCWGSSAGESRVAFQPHLLPLLSLGSGRCGDDWRRLSLRPRWLPRTCLPVPPHPIPYRYQSIWIPNSCDFQPGIFATTWPWKMPYTWDAFHLQTLQTVSHISNSSLSVPTTGVFFFHQLLLNFLALLWIGVTCSPCNWLQRNLWSKGKARTQICRRVSVCTSV